MGYKMVTFWLTLDDLERSNAPSIHLKLSSIEVVVVKSIVTIGHLQQIIYGLQDGDWVDLGCRLNKNAQIILNYEAKYSFVETKIEKKFLLPQLSKRKILYIECNNYGMYFLISAILIMPFGRCLPTVIQENTSKCCSIFQR